MRFRDLFKRGIRQPGPGIRDVVRGFESLGYNCEFGLVQRYAGFEPSGLLKFSATGELDALVHALDSDFRHYGVDGDLIIQPGPHDTIVCLSRRYGFAYTVSDAPAAISSTALAEREARKIAFLKRLFLEDLATGEKTFVRKSLAGEAGSGIDALVRAMRRHGPSRLLHVVETGDPARPPTVRWRGDGVMEGSVPRFSPLDRAYDIDLAPWLSLCRQAHQLVHGTGWPERRARPRNLLARELIAKTSSTASEHVLGQGHEVGSDGLRLFAPAQFLPERDPHAVFTFSAWVWIPPGFTGRRVDAVISHHRLGWSTADLSVTGRWQRIWLGAKVPPDVKAVVVGVIANGADDDRFWSTGWRLDEGPVPAPAQPPSIRIEPGSSR